MKPLRFTGYSDDTFGDHGRTMVDADNCGSGEPIVFKVTGGPPHPDSPSFAPGPSGLYVWGRYPCSDDIPKKIPGGWMVGIQQLEEDEPLPAWPMRWSWEGYSVILEIDAPEGVTVERVC